MRRGVGLCAAQATTHPIEKQLISAAVLHDAGTGLGHRVVDSHARCALSACTGEPTIREFTDSHPAVSANWVSTSHRHEILSETIIQTNSATQAAAVQKRLVTLVWSCQHEPKGHGHYGKQRRMKTAGGQAIYRYSDKSGDRITSGGVSVIKNGHRSASVRD